MPLKRKETDMSRKKLWRLGIFSLAITLTLAWLGTVCVIGSVTPQNRSVNPLVVFEQAKAEDYTSDGACVTCHQAYAQSFEKSPHSLYSSNPKEPYDRQGCQSCHGPGKAHVEDREQAAKSGKDVLGLSKMKSKDASAVCLRCHTDTMKSTQWHRTAHARADLSCNSCHSVHLGVEHENETAAEKAKIKDAVKIINNFANVARPEPNKMLLASEALLCGKCHKRELSEFRHNFRHPLPEGRIVCSDCHDVHPVRAEQTRVSPNKSACITCHAKIAGPFVFEHDPVNSTLGDGCNDCHRPHGSHNPALLTTASRGLCGQCHTEQSNTHFPGQSCWNTGCHVAVHGSNTDRKLLRR